MQGFETIEEAIATALAHRGMLRADLARRTGVNPSTINDWVTGKHTPRGHHIQAVAAALQCWFLASPGGWILAYPPLEGGPQ